MLSTYSQKVQQQFICKCVCGTDLVAKSCPTLAISWTVASHAPLSMGFSRQGY